MEDISGDEYYDMSKFLTHIGCLNPCLHAEDPSVYVARCNNDGCQAIMCMHLDCMRAHAARHAISERRKNISLLTCSRRLTF